jgi:mono/diheme cytochrome c family protein
MGRIVFGIILGMLLVPVVALGWFWLGHPPVAVADSPLPQERRIAHLLLSARIDRELGKASPVQADETNLVAGAEVYRDQCATCHGYHGQPSSLGARMYPDAPPLWEKHHNNAVVGVSDDPPAETYWKVANGIRLTGMPSYQQILTENEMWQVSVLLANADKPLPPAALAILRKGVQPAPAPAVVKAPANK